MFDYFFKTSNGEIVIGQKPNIYIAGAGLLWLVQKITTGDVRLIAEFGTTIFLIIWAALEMYSGVNKFRKILGLVVLIVIIYGLL